MGAFKLIFLSALACHADARRGRNGGRESRKIECIDVCPQDYTPVCGSDGVTYDNECLFDLAACKNPRPKLKSTPGKCLDFLLVDNSCEGPAALDVSGEECEWYAITQGKMLKKRTNKRYPAGCFTNKKGNVFFNKGGERVSNKKTKIVCKAGPKCGAFESYDECGSGCGKKTCADVFYPTERECLSVCVKGCFCDKGYVRSEAGGECVQESACECTDAEAKAINKASLDPCTRVSCDEGELVKVSMACEVPACGNSKPIQVAGKCCPVCPGFPPPDCSGGCGSDCFVEGDMVGMCDNSLKCSFEYNNLGCDEYDCSTKELWTDAKKAWCCENEKLGCPECGPVCEIFCEHGNVMDEKGCPTCVCEEKPVCDRFCAKDYNPVCGSDGVTYGNKCEFDFAACSNPKLQLIKKGECECEPGQEDNSVVCEPKTCVDGQWATMVIDCLEEMGFPCPLGEHYEEVEGQCCSVCVADEDKCPAKIPEVGSACTGSANCEYDFNNCCCNVCGPTTFATCEDEGWMVQMIMPMPCKEDACGGCADFGQKFVTCKDDKNCCCNGDARVCA